MKYIKKVPDTPHAKEIYEVNITRHEVEILDLVLAMYSPFISNTKLAVLNGSNMRFELKGIRRGLNQIKQEIANDSSERS